MDYEKERVFEEKFPYFYSLLAAFSYGVEEGKSDWDIVKEEVKDCQIAQELLKEIDEFLKNRPTDFEHVVGDIANYYFDNTNEFLRWIEQIKRYITSIKGKLCG